MNTFREMRRAGQQLSEDETLRILINGTTGVLALHGDNGYPYAVPVNYLFRDGKILFHGALAGHKFDAMKRDDRVSFCVIGKDEIVPEKVTDYFRSVIVFGRVHTIDDPAEKREATLALGCRFSTEEEVMKGFELAFPHVAMFEITIEHMTGKEAIELAKQRG